MAGSTNKAPAFQFFAKEYLTDEAVVLMSLEEQGAYVRLLCHQWIEGSIPAALSQQARVLGVTTTKMKRMWPAIAPKFQATDDDPDRLANPRLERARQEQEEYSEQAREYGRRGARKRWGKPPEGDYPPDSGPRSPPNGDPIAPPLGSQWPASASATDVSTPPSPSAGAHRRAPEGDLGRLRAYLGPERAAAVDRMEASASHPVTWAAGIIGLYGPSGTDELVYANVPPPERPAILATALDRFAAEGRAYTGRYFRKFMEAVRDERSNGNGQGRAHGGAAPGEAAREASRTRTPGGEQASRRRRGFGT